MGIHDNHRTRMREKVFSGASQSFAPHEHLEVLLYSNISRSNTNEAAHALLHEAGDLTKVFKLPYEQLCNVKGIGASTAEYLTKLDDLIEYALHPYADTCDTLVVKEDVIKFAKKYFDFDSESTAFVIFVDSMLKVINIWDIKMSLYFNSDFYGQLVEQALSCGAHGVMMLRKSSLSEHSFAYLTRPDFERKIYEILGDANIKLHMYEEIMEEGYITGNDGLIHTKPILTAAQHTFAARSTEHMDD